MTENDYILDTFGSHRLVAETLQQTYGSQIHEMLSAWKNKNLENYQNLISQAEAELRQRYGFAFVKFTLIDYFDKPLPYYITVDVVEPQDQVSRMPFTVRPTTSHPDPGDLFKQLDAYYAIGDDLCRSGQLNEHDFQDSSIAAFHVIYGHRHPLLKPFGKLFKEGAGAYQQELMEIFLHDADENRRANAAFLLAYMEDGHKLIEILSQRLDDPSGLVRNNALRVMVYVAQQHPEIELPLHAIVQALNYPETTDRNKASAVLFMVSQHTENLAKYRSYFDQAVPVLLKMLALKQPNNHDIAYKILKIVAGQDFGEHDLPAWDAWYNHKS